ncbi:MAG: DUF5713 family protein [Gammaproteobacteria bacterium]
MSTEFDAYRKSLEKGMLDFMEHGDYVKSNVDECLRILDSFYASVREAGSKEAAMLLVKEAVEALNKLNSRCSDSLIETGQREDICMAIMSACAEFGFNDEGDDVTEEWREW